MFGLPIAFVTPWILTALVSLPIIWWLLRLTPPKPQAEVFPPTRILARLRDAEETPAQSPWWLTLLRLTLAGVIILAMAGPILNPQEQLLPSEGQTLIIMDDGWASAEDWENRKNTAQALVEEAASAGSTVILESTTGNRVWNGQPLSPDEALDIIEASEPRPFEPDHAATAARISLIIQSANPGNIVFLSDGLTHPNTPDLMAELGSLDANQQIFLPQDNANFAIRTIRNEPKELVGTIARSNTAGDLTLPILALDEKGLTIARTTATFNAAEATTNFSIEEPLELRNEIVRIEIDTVSHAAAVQLLDEGNQRRLVGLISGEKFDQSQPLLSPLYYISRALEPFTDIRRASDANVSASVRELINQRVSALVLADVGTLDEDTSNRLATWVEEGGMLIRFAGPRLGGSEDRSLLPVDIRPGDRRLGGALSWETPKALAPFERNSPFFGLEPPKDVLVNKQLLALQEVALEEKTWAVLEDGTPLVTAEQLSAGWIVLFHVSSDAEWSNLPLSGTFVEMLRRTINLSRSGVGQNTQEAEVSLAPLRVLNADGAFIPPDTSVRPLILNKEVQKSVSQGNPPGFYGLADGYEALNLFEGESELAAFDTSLLGSGFETEAYLSDKSFPLNVWLFVVAAVLLIADCIAVLWMAGGLRRMGAQARKATASLVLVACAATILPSPVKAQDAEVDIASVLKTRLAYVETGIEDVDRISEAGLFGLTRYLTSRTALEPGAPIGLDMSRDELSFYSLIYWPIDPSAPLPTTETMARVDAYMKEGGSILFDTRDQISGALGGTAASPAARTLQQILAGLDIPPLEPVPEDHVLTKSFYLLSDFPGRFSGGDLWVEVSQRDAEQEGRPVRIGDGVSSIMITSNDLAGAWAVDNSLRPLLPTIPPDPTQRNYAFRAGVNLMMYVLTGNYKSDQVHLPELLERLGQ